MTKAECAFQAAVREAGCIACRIAFSIRANGDIHHILRGGRRIGEMDVLCLCPPHHRDGSDKPPFISRHPYKARFENAYGTEGFLLWKTRELIQVAA